MKELAVIFFSMILVNNYVLVQFLGICPFLGVSKKLNSAFGMSCAVIFVMALATAVTWPLYTYLLLPNGMEYLQTIAYILIIAVLVQLVEIILKRFVPPLHQALGVYLPLITTNCADDFRHRQRLQLCTEHGVCGRCGRRLYAGNGAFFRRAQARRGRKTA